MNDNLYVELGGNAKWKKWCLEQGEAEGYSSDMSIPVLYNTHFATQYRDKLAAELEGRTWSPSDTPPPLPPAANSATQTSGSSSLRKPRTGLSHSNSYNSRSGSPSTSAMGGGGSPGGGGGGNKKAENESYFASLGSANANRSDNLPPSQGGKYVGFGSNAGGDGSSSSLGGDWNETGPASAVLSKGWGFLSSTISQINENVVRPAQEKATDPELQSQVWSLASRFQKTVIDATKVGSSYAAEGLKVASEQAKARGYDLGDLGSKHLEEFGKTDEDSGEYRAVGFHDEGGDQDDDESNDSHHRGFQDVGRFYTAVPNGSRGGADDHHHQVPSASDDWSKMAPLTAARQNSTRSNEVSNSSTPRAKPATLHTGTSKAKEVKKADDGWDEW